MKRFSAGITISYSTDRMELHPVMLHNGGALIYSGGGSGSVRRKFQYSEEQSARLAGRRGLARRYFSRNGPGFSRWLGIYISRALARQVPQ